VRIEIQPRRLHAVATSFCIVVICAGVGVPAPSPQTCAVPARRCTYVLKLTAILLAELVKVNSRCRSAATRSDFTGKYAGNTHETACFPRRRSSAIPRPTANRVDEAWCTYFRRIDLAPAAAINLSDLRDNGRL